MNENHISKLTLKRKIHTFPGVVILIALFVIILALIKNTVVKDASFISRYREQDGLNELSLKNSNFTDVSEYYSSIENREIKHFNSPVFNISFDYLDYPLEYGPILTEKVSENIYKIIQPPIGLEIIITNRDGAKEQDEAARLCEIDAEKQSEEDPAGYYPCPGQEFLKRWDEDKIMISSNVDTVCSTEAADQRSQVDTYLHCKVAFFKTKAIVTFVHTDKYSLVKRYIYYHGSYRYEMDLGLGSDFDMWESIIQNEIHPPFYEVQKIIVESIEFSD